ncbi:metallothionein-I transcription activator [Zopfia rhizophila CBS 207.26]|uniref:Metallothionein-I transcription activator n=1 Tax=Zopfia rhizophila CBS 207.26 TaxID=1314779 RepID=A0A6A6EEH8_9PEZI|nr:metallothionein-I transcription activator [Zopfia rhizophila CBS 207.26]
MSSYNPPTQGQQTAINMQTVNSAYQDNARSVEYTCGDCDSAVSLKRGEPIRCRNCGHRVLYKQRTNR